MTGRSAVVIGIGNPYRHDDGIGPAVADAIGRLQLPGVRVVLSDGEPASLLAAWAGAGLAIVADAARSEPPCPGRIHRLTGNELGGESTGASSHGFGVRYALRLGQALDRQPGQLVVIAVEGTDFTAGTGLSGPVTTARTAAVAAVRAELAGARPG
ncbi:MAG TPA: hydrogenase maturation protease [Streptosporangiaceae bacterium]|nr:hydrogenase maturation protease [Streptosporangiaceae bacterium]